MANERAKYLIAKGKRIFQAIIISLSYRRRGRVPRTHTKVLAKQIVDKGSFRARSEELTNKSLNKKLINKILLYSAKKNIIKPLPLYSVLNPETSSDSLSEKSKGVRLVSANAEINHIIARAGLIKMIGQWNSTSKGDKLYELMNLITLITIMANLTSYEIV